MKKEVRTVVYDKELRLEAYRFEGIVQPFPNHFHEYYVIGFMESGRRFLSCRNREYVIQEGDLLLFNPGDNHACAQSDSGVLDYRGFNIPKETMLELAEEITGHRTLPVFSSCVIRDEAATGYLLSLHEQIMGGSCEFDREEQLLFLISLLIRRYGQPYENHLPACRAEIDQACAFMEEHFADHLCLDQICRHVGLSKSTLLRAFTKSKGITPYSYLVNIRIGRAKKLLEQGVMPAEAALQTGFADQSHFSGYFHRFIGLSPGVYREIFSDE